MYVKDDCYYDLMKKVAFVSSYHVINVVAGSVKSILSTSSGGCVIMMISFEIVL